MFQSCRKLNSRYLHDNYFQQPKLTVRYLKVNVMLLETRNHDKKNFGMKKIGKKTFHNPANEVLTTALSVFRPGTTTNSNSIARTKSTVVIYNLSAAAVEKANMPGFNMLFY